MEVRTLASRVSNLATTATDVATSIKFTKLRPTRLQDETTPVISLITFYYFQLIWW